MFQIRFVCLLLVTAFADIEIATFDGATTLNWREQNDPVMGGGSVGTFTIDSVQKVGVMNGTVVNVPRLGAPGFIQAIGSGTVKDVSSCTNIVLNLKSSSAYTGYKCSFGSNANAHMIGKPFYQHGYKAAFQAPVGAFGDVVLPFNSFTLDWDDATGQAITTCAQNVTVCPTVAVLQDLQEVVVWAEGVNGDVHVEVKSVRASGCGAVMV